MRNSKFLTPEGWTSEATFTQDNIKRRAEEEAAHIVHYANGDAVELRLFDGRSYVVGTVAGSYLHREGAVYLVDVRGTTVRRFASRLRRPQLKRVTDGAEWLFKNELSRCPRHGPNCA